MKNKKYSEEDSLTRHKRRQRMFIMTFLSALLLMVSTYAWLSSSLNVKIQFFKMGVASNSGLFISLDGVEYSDSITISMDSIIMDIREDYPNHTNQWSYGLWPVSTNGIPSSNHDKFAVYTGDLVHTKEKNPNGSVKRLLNTVLREEKKSNPVNLYVAFDIFLKNTTGSPIADNLFFDETTFVDYEGESLEESDEEMDGILNSIRIGIVKIGSLPSDSDLNSIQNMGCNDNCTMTIYEPFSKRHTDMSIETALNYGIMMVDGFELPTYAIIGEGRRLEHTNGHIGTGIPLDDKFFNMQYTVKDFKEPLFEVPNAVTKARVYLWLEGQDLDSLETNSKGADIRVNIDFVKDTAGYE